MKTVLVCFLLLFGPPILAQTKAIEVDPNILMAEVAKIATENDKLKEQNLRFLKKITVKNIDDNNKILEQRSNWQGVGLKNEPVGIDLNELFVTTYLYKIEGYEQKNGHLCYKVSFQPKPNLSDRGNGYRRVAIRFNGTMWIDIETLYIIHLVAEMPRERGFSIWWPAGKIYKVRFETKQSIRPDLHDIAVIDLIDVQIEYRYIMKHWYKNYFHEYINYHVYP